MLRNRDMINRQEFIEEKLGRFDYAIKPLKKDFPMGSKVLRELIKSYLLEAIQFGGEEKGEELIDSLDKILNKTDTTIPGVEELYDEIYRWREEKLGVKD